MPGAYSKPDQLPRPVRSAQGDPRRRPSRARPALLHRAAADAPTARRGVRSLPQARQRTRPRKATAEEEKRQQVSTQIGCPRFKAVQRFNQVLFVAGDGAKWEPAGSGRWAYASFQAVGRLKVKQHRQLVGRIKTLQVKREHRRWFVIVVTETEAQPLPSTGRTAGIDVGVARFLVTSDGGIITNPRFLDGAQATIKDLQRRRERATRGSSNHKRIRRQLARERRRVRNQRHDFHHKTARTLVGAYDVISLEELKIGNLTGSAKGTIEAPGTNIAQKAGLNRSILDAAWGQFIRILTAKAESAGRRVVRVDPAYTSIDCHGCGNQCTRPRQDTVLCPRCGAWDADLNGARNIASRAGLGSGQSPRA